jgi:hypothetical protein
MVWFCIEEQHSIFKNFILKPIDLNHSKDLFAFGRILNPHRRVMHDQFFDLHRRGLHIISLTTFAFSISAFRRVLRYFLYKFFFQ